MKGTEGAALRQEWINLGSPPCVHKTLTLLETDVGYLNSDCALCGEEVCAKSQ